MKRLTNILQMFFSHYTLKERSFNINKLDPSDKNGEEREEREKSVAMVTRYCIPSYKVQRLCYTILQQCKFAFWLKNGLNHNLFWPKT